MVDDEIEKMIKTCLTNMVTSRKFITNKRGTERGVFLSNDGCFIEVG